MPVRAWRAHLLCIVGGRGGISCFGVLVLGRGVVSLHMRSRVHEAGVFRIRACGASVLPARAHSFSAVPWSELWYGRLEFYFILRY